MNDGGAGGRAASLARGRRSSPLVAGVCLGVLALALYTLTASRGAEWQDSGIHQYRVIVGQVHHPFGLALAHPVHFWLGRLALELPIGEPLFRINLVSAVAGAITVGALAALVAALTGSALLAAITGLTLMVAHPFWQMSVVTETYTIAAACMTIEWVLLLRFSRSRNAAWLAAVFLVNGVHVADHLLGLLTLAPLGVLLLERIARGRVRLVWLPICGAAWTIGASPYLALIIDFYQTHGDAMMTLRSALFGGSEHSRGWSSQVLNTELRFSLLLLSGKVLGYAFPSFAVPIALLGLISRTARRRRMFRWVVLAQAVLIVAFVLRYSIRDSYTYYVPVCVLVAIYFALGGRLLLRRLRRVVSRRVIIAGLASCVVLPLTLYAVFPTIAESNGLFKASFRNLPFRNGYTYFLQPWRMLDTSAEQAAKAAIALAGPGGWLVLDSTPAGMTGAVAHLQGADVYVYMNSTAQCLHPLGHPSLDAVEFVRFVESGGRAFTIESGEVRDRLPAALDLVPEGPFMRFVMKRAE